MDWRDGGSRKLLPRPHRLRAGPGGAQGRGWGPSRAGWQRAWPRLGGELQKKAWAPAAASDFLHSLVVLCSAGSPGVTEDPGRRGRASSHCVLIHPGPRGRLLRQQRPDVTVPGVHQNEVIKRPVLSWACSYGTWIDSSC